MKYLVSACLMGDNCKYNGKNNLDKNILEFLKDKEYIKVCPECLGGLSIPRTKAEIINDKVINSDGVDVSNNYLNGASKTLSIALNNDCQVAIFKSKSPSCGCGKVYDGTFKKNLVAGDGITTRLLKENGIKVINNDEMSLYVEDL